MTFSATVRARVWLVVALGLTALKLWLTRGQGVFAIGNAGYDDRLFLELAQHLVRGEWLGPYNELTLAKGPFYSFFIAAVFKAGLPLFLAQHLFYAAACALFVRALQPAIPSAGWRLAIYALLLWNPMTFDATSMGRVLRQHVYGPLVLMIFAALIALYLRRAGPARTQAAWAGLLGLATAAFYLTREEWVWLVPAMLLLAAAYVYGSWRISRATARAAALWLGFAAVLAAVPLLLVSAKNRKHYGFFGTCEFRATEFKDAYGAMLRVKVGPELAFVPVTREAREAMAAVSPAFAAVQAELSKDIARNWAATSAAITGLPAESEQIAGGWNVWAFREATHRAGPHLSSSQVLARYRKIAREINAACDAGRLPAGATRSGFMPPWRADYTDGFVRATAEFADFVVRFSRFSARPPPSSGSPEELVLFRDLTGERLSPPEGELDVVGAAEYLLNLWKVGVLQQTGKALRPVLLILFWVAQVLALVRLVHAACTRQWTFGFTVATAAWSACAASIAVHAVIQATSYPVLTISSFAPIYPLLLVFVVAAFWDLATAWPLQRPAWLATAGPFIADAATEEPPAIPARRWHRSLPWLAGLAAVAPFLLWQGEFQKLFWFGDDLFLLDQMTVMTPLEWTFRVFAENFVPLFKLAWSAAVQATGGSYLGMLGLLWLTHAINTVVLGRVLLRAGFPWIAVVLTQLVFALTASNLETLGWATQWSAVLATLFFLLALDWHGRQVGLGGSWWRLIPLLIFATASACSFSRGVLTGAVVGAGLLLPGVLARDRRALLASLPGVLLCLVPAVTVALLIKFNSSGNHQQMGGHWGEALIFGGSYFLLNPGHLVFGETSLHPLVLLLLAGLKLGVIAGALRIARGRVLHVLLLLLAYDLGSALLVGIGRYHTGFLASLSSRYQYASLLATLPFATLLLAAALDRIPAAGHRDWIRLGTVLILIAACLRGWPDELRGFTGPRGTQLRALMAAPATDDPDLKVPALDFMHIERAKALQRTYGLH